MYIYIVLNGNIILGTAPSKTKTHLQHVANKSPHEGKAAG